jgi:hypothetical protein
MGQYFGIGALGMLEKDNTKTDPASIIAIIIERTMVGTWVSEAS